MKKPRKHQFEDFADELMDLANQGLDFGGDDIQQIALDHGLVEEVMAKESCGKNCGCVEYDFPVVCFRKLY